MGVKPNRAWGGWGGGGVGGWGGGGVGGWGGGGVGGWGVGGGGGGVGEGVKPNRAGGEAYCIPYKY